MRVAWHMSVEADLTPSVTLVGARGDRVIGRPEVPQIPGWKRGNTSYAHIGHSSWSALVHLGDSVIGELTTFL